ncbi:splicing factor family protein [Striga asiatica]|uniref:Splicing factor family protein n=1 Tax=Striga asiatica TaxID=4170 RepID=A0A5A7Q9P7_STRAF|nr:splicing factor family protein [Striga asiatica]
MYLYDLTLQQATNILYTINDNFSGRKLQGIFIARGKVFDLLRPDENGKSSTSDAISFVGRARPKPTGLSWSTQTMPLRTSFIPSLLICSKLPWKSFRLGKGIGVVGMNPKYPGRVEP